jgi:hypothetical protein
VARPLNVQAGGHTWRTNTSCALEVCRQKQLTIIARARANGAFAVGNIDIAAIHALLLGGTRRAVDHPLSTALRFYLYGEWFSLRIWLALFVRSLGQNESCSARFDKAAIVHGTQLSNWSAVASVCLTVID